MIKIYEILSERDTETKLLYKVWEVSDGFPIPSNFTKLSPPNKYNKEKFDYMSGSWVEDVELVDKEKIGELEDMVEKLQLSNKDLETKLKASTTRSEMTEMALLELYDMILTR